jgi:hypothetical protein
MAGDAQQTRDASLNGESVYSSRIDGMILVVAHER